MGSSSSKGVVTQLPSQNTDDPGPIAGPSGSNKPRRISSIDNNNSSRKRRKVSRDKNDLEPSSNSNTLFENVFLFSFGSTSGDRIPGECMQLDKARDPSQTQLTKESIPQCLCERLQLKPTVIITVLTTTKPNKQQSPLVPSELTCTDETSHFRYLFQCYSRLKILEGSKEFPEQDDDVSVCQSAIMEAARDGLQYPDKWPGHVHEQFLALLLEHQEKLNDKESRINKFLLSVMVAVEENEASVSLQKTMSPVLDLVHTWFKRAKLSDSQLSGHLAVLQFFSDRSTLAMVFMKYNKPKDPLSAPSYQSTLLGTILALNPCPSKADGLTEFFLVPLDMSRDDIHTTLLYIYQRLDLLSAAVNKVLYSCMTYSLDHRHVVMDWIGHVLHLNRPKPDIWSAHEAEVFDGGYCSDGFCLTLCGVLLKFCKPFCCVENQSLLDIEPGYCRQATPAEEDAKRLGLHARGLNKEKTLVHKDVTIAPPPERYRFVTECYFLTQLALHISCSIVHKLIKLNNDIGRLKSLQVEMKSGYHNPKIMDLLIAELNRENRLFLNMNAALQNIAYDAFRFHIASASWLVQVASADKPSTFEPLRLPLSEEVPTSLSCLPEFVMSNFTLLTYQLQLTIEVPLLKENAKALNHFLNLVLVYMGSPERVQNSEIRAGLAETLDAVLPTLNQDGTWSASETGALEELLKTHPQISHLAESLLHVFVSIEMRGQSVDSEKMFNYRRFIHKVLQYIWKIPIHKEAVTKLSQQALLGIDNTEPPLFLRFINLLINDSIFLLDEALDHMKQIRAFEMEKDKGEWNDLSPEQYRDNEIGLRNLKVVGHHRNTTANFTIYSLMLLTREHKEIFCHSMMVDRITGMLNYFLEHMVGPKQSEYKVNNRRELDFRPEQLVSDITHIYLYLGTSENFCKAVIGEARSFSHSLFDSALPILKKIGVQEDFISRFEEFARKLKSMEKSVQREEEMMADAPEDFLDPIMGSLMVEPVILPTSSTTVDKAVIARHLLSDQSDPFNRQPLSLDMVKPNTELKEKIEQWRAEMNNKHNSQTEDSAVEDGNEEESKVSKQSDISLYAGE